MEKLSFSESTKDEIVNYNWNKKELTILLYSFIRTNSIFKNNELIIKTTLKRHKKIIKGWIREIYGVEVDEDETNRIVHLRIRNKSFISQFIEQLGNLELKSTTEFGAYIAGSFLGKGWINNSTSKFYHFEIRVKEISHSLDLIEAFDAVGIKAVTLFKDGWYYTYIKKSILISDVLKLMNTTKSLLEFEDQRIQRDFISNMTKLDSIEPHNQLKTSIASTRQINAIKKLMQTDKVLLLTTNQKKLIELRLSNPHLSLQDLAIVFAEKHSKLLSRSTINNWLKRAEELSK